ncbi:MAG TPA: LysR family transcriptional regulator [Kofleriaceae bacterium]|nr:LysR family transcriptional regulator [Kofleriaceae bacterium]
MNYHWLFAFTAFAEHRNFTRTARELHLSQPALFVQIRKLSELVGRPLYRRVGRDLVLTAEGEKLAAYGREVHARGRTVLSDVRGQADAGPVRLASGQGAFRYLLGPVVAAWSKRQWPLQLQVISGPAIINAVRDARADVGVAVSDSPIANVQATPLVTIGHVAMLPRNHRLAAKRVIRPVDLDGEAIIVPPVGSPHRSALTQAIRTAGGDLLPAVEVTGWELMLHFAKQGVGIAVVNDFCPVPTGMVARVVEGLPPIHYQLLTRPGALSARTAALGEAIVAAVAAQAAASRAAYPKSRAAQNARRAHS